MSATAIRDALVAAVKSHAVTSNVYGEDIFPDSAEKAAAMKLDGPEVHWWVVSVDPMIHAEGLGWHEVRFRVRIVGTYGRDRKAAEASDASDVRWRETVADVVDALTAPANRFPGLALDTTTPRVGPIVGRGRIVAGRNVACHEVAIEYEAQEE